MNIKAVSEKPIFHKKIKSANISVERSTNRSYGRDSSIQSAAQSARQKTKINKRFGDLLELLISKSKVLKRAKGEFCKYSVYNSMLVARLMDRLDAGKLNFSTIKQSQEKASVAELRQLYDKLLGQLEEGQKNLGALKSFLNRFQKEFKLHLKNYREPIFNAKKPALQKSKSTKNYDSKVSRNDTEVVMATENKPTEAERVQKLSRSLNFLPDIQFGNKKDSKQINNETLISKELPGFTDTSIPKTETNKTFAKRISKTPEIKISSIGLTMKAVKAFTQLRASKRDSEALVPKFSFAGSSLSVKVIGDEEPSKRKSTVRMSNLMSVGRVSSRQSSIIKDHGDSRPKSSQPRDSRTSLVFGSDREKRKVVSTRTFYLNRKAQSIAKKHDNLPERMSKIIEGTQEITEVKELSISDEIGSVTSSIGESIIEEIQEDIMERMKVKNEVSSTKNGLAMQKVKPSFIPIKISFYIGNQSLKMAASLQATKERIYRDFDIREMHWHLKDTAIVGLQLYLYNRKEKYYLQGKLHGVEGNKVDTFILKPWETFTKLDFISDSNEILTIRLTTNLARTFKTGKNKTELEKEGRRYLSRYFPKEVKLCKFFSAFDPSTERLLNIRFMYVRTVFY